MYKGSLLLYEGRSVGGSVRSLRLVFTLRSLSLSVVISLCFGFECFEPDFVPVSCYNIAEGLGDCKAEVALFCSFGVSH